jgi:hypothetical protein
MVEKVSRKISYQKALVNINDLRKLPLFVKSQGSLIMNVSLFEISKTILYFISISKLVRRGKNIPNLSALQMSGDASKTIKKHAHFQF